MSIMLLIYVQIWKLLGMSILQYNVVFFWKILPIISNAWRNVILKILIISFLQHVPTMPNNYSLWLLFFLLKTCHKSISHNLINEKYGLHILSLIWHLIPCSNVLLLTLDATIVFHLFPWGSYPIALCLLPSILFATFILDFCTLHKQPYLC